MAFREPNSDEIFLFADEAPESLVELGPALTWRCLIVDDDEGVHQSMVFAMNNLVVENGRIEWLHAYTAGEAREVLAGQRDVAVVVLDVVMEHDRAGLDLVHAIRSELGLTDTRIILHTGQPGFAPEIAAIREYDINDYRTKSELTRNHIYTCLASAIRTYRQIRGIEAGRVQLRHIIQAGNALMNEPDEGSFARAALDRFAGLLGVEANGCALFLGPEAAFGKAEVAAVSGLTATPVGSFLAELGTGVQNLCLRSLSQPGAVWDGAHVALRVGEKGGRELLLYLQTPEPMGTVIDASVIETFVAYCGAALKNRALLERLHHDAYFDRLLGLPNRQNLGEVIDACYAAGNQTRQVLALIDIDRFGEINEALGQAFGDALLVAVASRLRDNLPATIILARLAADVFAVFGSADQVTPKTLLPLFANPMPVREEDTMVSVTMGLTRLADVETNGCSAALEAAFQALRVAKTYQRGQLAWYTPELSRQTLERVNILNGLRHALRQDQLFVVYQPQISMADQRLIGLEALVRWRTGKGGQIGPDRFIPVAEQSGLIREIGCFVLRQACAVLGLLHAEGQKCLRMAVNVSAIQFRHPAFLEEVREVIAMSGIDPHHLELEITESVAMEDAGYVREALDSLHSMGIKLAIDDFGTGYSSLAQLKSMAVDRLKIDRAFVRDLTEARADASIAGVVIQLGKRLGREVIAEGVETETQAAVLHKLGCQEAQGFLFGRPMELPDLRAWMVRAAEQRDGAGQGGTCADSRL